MIKSRAVILKLTQVGHMCLQDDDSLLDNVSVEVALVGVGDTAGGAGGSLERTDTGDSLSYKLYNNNLLLLTMIVYTQCIYYA